MKPEENNVWQMVKLEHMSLTELLASEIWMLFSDPMGHGMLVKDQGGFLMSPQQLEEVIDEISEFLAYHGWDKLKNVVQQQWDSISPGAATFPAPATALLYPEEYARAREQSLSARKERPARAKVSRSGFVYVVLADTLYKIGRTMDFKKRLHTLNQLLPYELETIAVIETEDMYKLEEKLHNKFASKRKKGEWFRLEDEDIEYLKGLANGAKI